jgi:dTMP kinase
LSPTDNEGASIQQASRQTEIDAGSSPGEEGSYLGLLKNKNFRRFFAAQSVSSLGDWIGVIAIAVFAQENFGTAAVGAVMTARVLPGFFVGPLAGVVADRWDRKKTMVVADVIRAVIVFSLPLVPNLIYFLVASAVLESLTLTWGPAKDASLPHFVPRGQLTHANSLSLLSIYGPWPLAALVFAALTPIAASLGESVVGENIALIGDLQRHPEWFALWLDSLTFGISAIVISSLAIPPTARRTRRLDMRAVWEDLVAGLRFVGEHKQVRPWLLGIAITFTAAGGVFSLGLEFVESILGAGSSGFSFLVGFLGTGMIVGLLSAGLLVKRVAPDVLFSSSVMLLGVGLIGLASMSSLGTAIPMASALGFFGGTAYSTGYSLMQETTEDEFRGRTFSAAYTLIRIGTLVGLGVFPLIAGAIGSHVVSLPGDRSLALPGSRVTFWIAGLVVVGGGALSMRAIKARRAESQPRTPRTGFFVVFEGGEGAGKTTQMDALARWFEARGSEVVTTREPGGTAIGERIRAVLLDPDAAEMDERTEALLYAADRAQHVAEVIRPALESGKVVLSDRFVDSSLAYQGLARGLGLEKIYDLNRFGTGGVLPDLVLLMKIDPETALGRKDGELDRLEREQRSFHERVEAAYRELSERFPDRFVVLDASCSPEEVHASVVKALFDNGSDHLVEQAFLQKDLPSPGAPVPR